MNLKHSLTKTAGKRLVAISFAALSILAISPTPTPANATPTTPNTQETCLQEDTPPDYFFWVSTKGGTHESNNPVGNDRIARVKINSSFNGGTIQGTIHSDISPINNRTYPEFGDIAVVQDYSSVYGIEFNKKKKQPTHIVKYSEDNGDKIWTKYLLGAGFTNRTSRATYLNSLSVGPHNELIFGSAGNGEIYIANPQRPTEDHDTPVPVEKLKIHFPKIENKQIVSAGDFLVLPDGSLLGFGTDDWEKGVVVKWKINNDLKADVPGIIIGRINSAPYGVGRVGSHILFVAPQDPKSDNFQMTVQDLDLSNAKEMPENPAVNDVPKLDTTSFKVEGFSSPLYGASSSGDAGQAANEFKLIVKTVFSNAEKKADGTSKYPSGRLRDEDQAIAYSSDACGAKFAPPAPTTGTQPGIQNVEHQEFVVAGTKHKLIEHLTYDPNWIPGTPSTAETMGFYNVSLSCVDGANKNIPVDQLDLTSKKASSVIKIPQKGDITGPITCTFTNTPADRPRPRLPLTGAETTPWQILGGIIVLGVLAAYPLARRMKTEGKAK